MTRDLADVRLFRRRIVNPYTTSRWYDRKHDGTKDTLWQLQCKNEKCNEFFDYFGRLSTMTTSAALTAENPQNTSFPILRATTLRNKPAGR